MDPDYHEQVQRLQQYRRAVARQNTQINNLSSSQEDELNGDPAQNEAELGETSLRSDVENEHLQDPLIYPGLYAPSGFDMIGILVRVRIRPNPVVDIGNIDSSAALVLCDTTLPDLPIVYCSEPFEALTGYSSTEVLGKNCRFLQHPHPNVLRNVSGTREVDQMNEQARAELRQKIASGEEAQVRLVNYTRGGIKFFNLLTTIPISWDEGMLSKRYMVGFQAQDNMRFR